MPQVVQKKERIHELALLLCIVLRIYKLSIYMPILLYILTVITQMRIMRKSLFSQRPNLHILGIANYQAKR